MEKTKKPIKSYKAGVLSLSVWENIVKGDNGEDRILRSYTLQRAYKDKDEWKHTSTLRVQDLPKVAVLINRAYEDQILKTSEIGAEVEGLNIEYFTSSQQVNQES